MADAAMHMYSAAIDTLPDAHDSEFPQRAGNILAGLRKLQGSLSEAAGLSRVTPVGDRGSVVYGTATTS